jgi:hypothetical protein
VTEQAEGRRMKTRGKEKEKEEEKEKEKQQSITHKFGPQF